jgi:hypothetical protein
MRNLPLLLFLALHAWAQAERLEDTLYISLNHPAIHYDQPSDDPIARLEKRLEGGSIQLDFAPGGWGYLPAVLQQLGISIDSQVLVFSKTSIQLPRISPRTPRAIYFNDEVAVGYIQNGEVLELTSLDPKLGILPYTLDAHKSEKPEFSRRDDCLTCHQGPVTLGVPGILISSVHPRSAGAGDGHGSAYMTDHRTPFSERWGGWYVTGTHGAELHLGNNVGLADPLSPAGRGEPETQNVTDLSGWFNTSRYLAPTSDIVALMTFEHQTRMTNLITRIGWDARIAEHDGGKLMNSEIEELVSYMLFVDEAPLRAPVAGVSTFAKTFVQRGPRDKQGRSLRDFDLRTRLFQYPLSYMIYSAAFDHLPQTARERIYQRLYDVLTGEDQSQAFARLSADGRRAMLEIVRDTKANLPSYWSVR